MAEDPDPDDKKFPPTPRRLREMRDQGRAPAPAADFSGFFLFAVGLAGVTASFDAAERPVREALGLALGYAASAERIPETAAREVFSVAIGAVAAVWPPLLMAAIAGLAASFVRLPLTIGPVLSTRLIAPRFERLFSLERWKSIFFLSSESRIDFLVATLKFVVVAAAAWTCLRSRALELLRAGDRPVAEAARAAAAAAGSIAAWVVLSYGALGLLDLLRRVYRFRRDAFMTRQEMKDEAKLDEGSEEVRGMKKQAQRDFFRRMQKLARVKQADVGLGNPTHYFVGLRIDPVSGVPQVWVRGEDSVALLLRDACPDAGVPFRAEPELARTLYALDEGAYVPTELFDALEEVYRWAAVRYSEAGRNAPWEDRKTDPVSAGSLFEADD